jgi:ATP-binding cassette subfamily B protein
MRERSAGIGSFLIETLQANRLVVSSNAQERESNRFRKKNDAFIAALMAMRRLTYLSGGLPGLLIGMSSAVVFLYGGFRVIGGAITVGTLVAFAAYQMRLLSPVQGLMGLYASIATARVSLGRVREILDFRVEVTEKPDAKALSDVAGEVKFDDVTLAFRPDADALADVTFEVPAGKTVAIVGPSGSGKSTIADLVVRLLDPKAGRVLLDGQDLRDVRLADLRSHVVLVDQDPFIFHATVAENIRYGRPGASDVDVVAAVDAAGITDLVASLPHGMDTLIGERGKTLSAGERQRIAIARAFLADPAVLILDEATAALDPGSERDVVAGYESLMRGRTTILITHRYDLARRADRVLVLERGRVVEEGQPASLLERPGRFREMFAASVPSL